MRESLNKGARSLMGSYIKQNTPQHRQQFLESTTPELSEICFQTLGRGIVKLLSLSFPRLVSFVYFLTVMSHPLPSRKGYFNS